MVCIFRKRRLSPLLLSNLQPNAGKLYQFRSITLFHFLPTKPSIGSSSHNQNETTFHRATAEIVGLAQLLDIPQPR